MKFSIIIPTCNRSASLKKTINSIVESDFNKKDLEIIIVDNSTILKEKSNTKKMVRNYASKLKIAYYFSENGGPSYARNIGVCKSNYMHLVFLDDDVLLIKKYFKILETVWGKSENAAIIGGKVIPKMAFELPKYVKTNYRWVYALNDLGNKNLKLHYPQMLFSANLSIKLNKFDKKNKIFNEILGKRYFPNLCIFGEDVELCYRTYLEYKTIIYDPALKVYNKVDLGRNRMSYYLKRIILGGIERYLVDKLLSRNYPNHQFYPLKNEYIHNLKLFIKNKLGFNKYNNSFYETNIYSFSYVILGPLFYILFVINKIKYD